MTTRVRPKQSDVLRAVSTGNLVLRARNHCGSVGCEEYSHWGNVVWLQPADFQRHGGCAHVPSLLGCRTRWRLLAGFTHGLGQARLIAGESGVDETRDDCIDRDVVLAK